MLFSVILCVNKKIPFLGCAIKSILEQNYSQKFEFIIVANNCNDELYDYLESFNDNRIKLFRTNIGQLSFNLNYAVNLSSGDYIIRMDADDVSLPNRLEITQKAILDFQPDVIGFSADFINEKGEIIGVSKDFSNRDVKRLLLFRNPFIHPTVAIKKELLLSISGYFGGRQSEDYDLWIRMAKLDNIRFIISQMKVLSYRITDGQSRGNTLPYCEVSSYFLREFLLSWHPKYFFALLFSIMKRIFLSKK